MRKRERERERERERCPEMLFLILKGMTGALAPFSYLVSNRSYARIIILAGITGQGVLYRDTMIASFKEKTQKNLTNSTVICDY